jgi:hypothetical protein
MSFIPFTQGETLTAAALNAALVGVSPPSGPTFSVGAGQAWVPDTYFFTAKAAEAGTIASVTSFVASGTETFTIYIAGVPVTGLTAVSESSTTATDHLATGANTFAAGQTVSISVSGTALGFNITLNLG